MPATLRLGAGDEFSKLAADFEAEALKGAPSADMVDALNRAMLDRGGGEQGVQDFNLDLAGDFIQRFHQSRAMAV